MRKGRFISMVIIMICIVILLPFTALAEDYQQWNSFVPTPELTSNYPYQVIVNINGGNKVLFLCTNPIKYTSNAVNTGDPELKGKSYWWHSETNSWSVYLTTFQIGSVVSIAEANSDIYDTNGVLVFGRTTPYPEQAEINTISTSTKYPDITFTTNTDNYIVKILHKLMDGTWKLVQWFNGTGATETTKASIGAGGSFGGGGSSGTYGTGNVTIPGSKIAYPESGEIKVIIECETRILTESGINTKICTIENIINNESYDFAPSFRVNIQGYTNQIKLVVNGDIKETYELGANILKSYKAADLGIKLGTYKIELIEVTSGLVVDSKTIKVLREIQTPDAGSDGIPILNSLLKIIGALLNIVFAILGLLWKAITFTNDLTAGSPGGGAAGTTTSGDQTLFTEGMIQGVTWLKGIELPAFGLTIWSFVESVFSALYLFVVIKIIQKLIKTMAQGG